MRAKFKVQIYTCHRHPTWKLESSAPLMAGSLKQFCPHCKDEFWEKQIGLANHRTETRERDDDK